MDQTTSQQPAPVRDDGKTPWRLLVLLMTMTAVGSLALNILVPAVPRLAELLASDKETIQLTISLYISGLAVAQLFAGPLSDRFGRRPVVLGGLALLTCASLAATAASSALGLITVRVLQAFGGATGVVIGRAIIRDLFGRDKSAQMLGLVASAMAVAPMVAPLIGGVLDTWFGWQAIFIFVASFASIVFVWAWQTLPETRAPRAEGVEPDSLRANLGVLFRSPRFIGYILSAAFGSGAFFVFVGAGPHVIITMLGRTPTEYGLWFIPTALGYVLGNLMTSRISVRFGIDRSMVWGNVINFIGGASGLVLLFFVDTLGPLAIAIPATLMGVGNGVLLPNSIAGAVSVRPQAAGTASGILGFTQMAFGALTVQIAGHLVAGATTPTPMMVHMFAVGAATWAAYLLLVRPRRS